MRPSFDLCSWLHVLFRIQPVSLPRSLFFSCFGKTKTSVRFKLRSCFRVPRSALRPICSHSCRSSNWNESNQSQMIFHTGFMYRTEASTGLSSYRSHVMHQSIPAAPFLPPPPPGLTPGISTFLSWVANFQGWG